jgi:hypothetical protein
MCNLAMSILPADGTRIIYWHRDLPPTNAEAAGEDILEANSMRIPGTFAHRDELWQQCYEDLMVQARLRLQQEITRLGGNYAHVLNESVASQHDYRRELVARSFQLHALSPAKDDG